MHRRKLLAGLAAAVFLAAAPTAATAEEIVPPDNSAAIQYTETLPTPRGQKDAEKKKKGKGKPTDVLGQKNAKKLEKKGKQGREVAEFTAETGPGSVAPESSGSGSESRTPGKADGAKKETGQGSAPGPGGGGTGSGGGPTETAGVSPAEGSSPLGEVAGQATGTTSGELGLLLPLAIVAAIVWAAFYWRQRRRIA